MATLVAIVGPTASGKSDLAVKLAAARGGEIINADSRQFYRGLDIGTAKPPAAARAATPHHLLDFLTPHEFTSVAQFLALARAAIANIASRGRLPIVAGGSGQYIKALLEGWSVPPVRPDARTRGALETELSKHGVAHLARRLEELDPDTAEQTDPDNPRRVVRALERVLLGAGERPATAAPLAAQYDVAVIGVEMERDQLHRRIQRRVDRMFAAGWVAEVERLLERGVDIAAPGMVAIGYREIARAVRSGDLGAYANARTAETAQEQVKLAIVRATNRLVRHQHNWFKPNDPRIKWVRPHEDPEALYSHI